MDFEIRRPRGLHADVDDKVELVIIQTPHHTQTILMTWDELRTLGAIVQRSVLTGHVEDSHELLRNDGFQLVRKVIDSEDSSES